MKMHRYRNGDANLILHCQIEADRIPKITEKLEKLKDIMELHKREEK